MTPPVILATDDGVVGPFMVQSIAIGNLPTGVVRSIFTSTTTAIISNSSSETSLIGSGVGTLTLAANALAEGRTIRIRVWGVLSSLGVLPGNLTLKVKFGSTVIASTGAVALTTGLSSAIFVIECDITCRSTGGSGSVMAQGKALVTTALADISEPMSNGTSTVTIDTTASNVVGVTAQFSTANAANSISGTNCTIEILN